MEQDFYIEVNSQQRNHDGEKICGDVFLYRYVKEEDRVIAVLSDGMGSGVKANILATLTSTMALNFTREHKEVDRIAEIIMNHSACLQRKENSICNFYDCRYREQRENKYSRI